MSSRALPDPEQRVTCDVVFEAVTKQLCRWDLVDLGNSDVLDDFRPLLLRHIGQRLLE